MEENNEIKVHYFNPYRYVDARCPQIITAEMARELTKKSDKEMDECMEIRLTDRINVLIFEAASRKENKIAVLLPRDYWYQMVNQYRYWEYDVEVVERDKDAGSVIIKISWR
jgi:hypothetical protein